MSGSQARNSTEGSKIFVGTRIRCWRESRANPMSSHQTTLLKETFYGLHLQSHVCILWKGSVSSWILLVSLLKKLTWPPFRRALTILITFAQNKYNTGVYRVLKFNEDSLRIPQLIGWFYTSYRGTPDAVHTIPAKRSAKDASALLCSVQIQYTAIQRCKLYRCQYKFDFRLTQWPHQSQSNTRIFAINTLSISCSFLVIRAIWQFSIF